MTAASTSEALAQKTGSKGSKTTTGGKVKTKVKAPEAVTLSSLSHKIENMDLDQCEDTIRSHDLTSGISYFQIGGALSRITEGELWKQIKEAGEDGKETKKFDRLEDYVDERWGFGYRKAKYLVDLYRKLVEIGVEVDQIEGIGWAKLRQVVSVLTKDNVDGWLKKCKALNTSSLVEAVRDAKKGVLDNENDAENAVSDWTTYSVKVTHSQKEVIKEAVTKGMEESETEHNGTALANICTHYLGNPVQTVSATESLSLKEHMDQLKEAGLSIEEAAEALEKVWENTEVAITLFEDAD